MQENEGLLSQKNEEGVSELGHLGEHKQDGPEARDPITSDVTEITEWLSMTFCCCCFDSFGQNFNILICWPFLRFLMNFHLPRVTDREVHSVLQRPRELWQRSDNSDEAEGGEGDVPDDEEGAHFVPRPAMHPLLQKYDHGEIARCKK